MTEHIGSHDSLTSTISSKKQSENDVEKALDDEKPQPQAEPEKNPKLVEWEDGDPERPYNWSARRRWTVTIVVSAYAFISPMTSSIMAPALSTISREFDITNPFETQMTLSIFILGYAVGPLLLAPLSEEYGRRPILQASNIFFLAFNIGCGFAQSSGQLIAFRLLAGIGGSAPLAIGGGTLTDIWTREERSKSVSIYAICPVLGPACGPIFAGFIVSHTTWRWCFWATSIADLVLQGLGTLFLKETYGPVLLKRKAKRLRKQTGDDGYKTQREQRAGGVLSVLRQALVRPMKMLVTEPIVQVLGLFMAYVYGLLYLILSTFAALFEVEYHEELDIVGLNYVALAVGFMLGAQFTAQAQPRIYSTLQTRLSPSQPGKPEYRIPLLLLGAVLTPTGIFIYAWTAAYHTHWMGPDVGVAIFAAGSTISFQCISGYLMESYRAYAASALAAVTCARSVTGFGFALFAPYLYEALGYGWGGSLLGFVAVAVGVPAVVGLWVFGEGLRGRGTRALVEGN